MGCHQENTSELKQNYVAILSMLSCFLSLVSCTTCIWVSLFYQIDAHVTSIPHYVFSI